MLADPGNPFPHEQLCVFVCVGVRVCGSHEHEYAITVLVCEHKRPADLSKRKERQKETQRGTGGHCSKGAPKDYGI